MKYVNSSIEHVYKIINDLALRVESRPGDIELYCHYMKTYHELAYSSSYQWRFYDKAPRLLFTDRDNRECISAVDWFKGTEVSYIIFIKSMASTLKMANVPFIHEVILCVFYDVYRAYWRSDPDKVRSFIKSTIMNKEVSSKIMRGIFTVDIPQSESFLLHAREALKSVIISTLNMDIKEKGALDDAGSIVINTAHCLFYHTNGFHTARGIKSNKKFIRTFGDIVAQHCGVYNISGGRSRTFDTDVVTRVFIREINNSGFIGFSVINEIEYFYRNNLLSIDDIIEIIDKAQVSSLEKLKFSLCLIKRRDIVEWTVAEYSWVLFFRYKKELLTKHAEVLEVAGV